MNTEFLFFIVVALGALVSGILMVTRKNPIISALYLVVNFFCLALLYLLLRAQFIAIIQILVYAGAIMVLFLFVIMLLSLGDERVLKEKKSFLRVVGVALGIGVIVALVVGIVLPARETPSNLASGAAELGTVESIGASLFSTYVIPFEIVSYLLLAAMVGVVLLAKKHLQNNV